MQTKVPNEISHRFDESDLQKHILTFLLLAPLATLHAADALIVYPAVSGLAASEHYKVRVRLVGDDNHRPY